jgi:mono/diheme cytochrome c family protein
LTLFYCAPNIRAEFKWILNFVAFRDARGRQIGGALIRRFSTFLIGLGFLLPISLPMRAQQSSATPLTDTQIDGRRIFQQRCAVCHTQPTVVSKRYGPALYKEIVEDNEDNIREAILEGREGLMPGFKYGLTRPEVDSIVEYLKTVNRPARPKSNPNQKERAPASAGE